MHEPLYVSSYCVAIGACFPPDSVDDMAASYQRALLPPKNFLSWRLLHFVVRAVMHTKRESEFPSEIRASTYLPNPERADLQSAVVWNRRFGIYTAALPKAGPYASSLTRRALTSQSRMASASSSASGAGATGRFFSKYLPVTPSSAGSAAS